MYTIEVRAYAPSVSCRHAVLDAALALVVARESPLAWAIDGGASVSPGDPAWLCGNVGYPKTDVDVEGAVLIASHAWRKGYAAEDAAPTERMIPLV
jgi:hypothetical protein